MFVCVCDDDVTVAVSSSADDDPDGVFWGRISWLIDAAAIPMLERVCSHQRGALEKGLLFG